MGFGVCGALVFGCALALPLPAKREVAFYQKDVNECFWTDDSTAQLDLEQTQKLGRSALMGAGSRSHASRRRRRFTPCGSRSASGILAKSPRTLKQGFRAIAVEHPEARQSRGSCS
jgi:hypothetical protein